MLKLKLDRPLAVFDIESTGLNRKADRIIDLALCKLWPDGREEPHTFLVHPGIPIPPEASAIHGFTDEMVKDCPSFKDVAPQVAEILKDCDLAGYNILGFDIPLLIEELARAGITFNLEGRRILDAQRIYHKKVPRDLAAALAFYCGEMHMDAHDAMGDVQATLRVLAGQFERYPDLPRDLDGLDAFCNPRDPSWVDRTGKFKWVNGEAVINFGKKQGQSLKDTARDDPGLLRWITRGDFPKDAMDIAQKALNGKFPAPPTAPSS